MDPPPAVAAPSSRFVERLFKRHGWKPCPSRSCRRVDNRRNKPVSKFSADWPSGGMDLVVFVAPSSQFVEGLAKRHGWKPCPPVFADERIRRNSGPHSLRNALGCGREWTLLSRVALLRRGLSNGAINGTLRLRSGQAQLKVPRLS